jgi:hypothetical protein
MTFPMAGFINLPCADKNGHFNVVVEAPRNSLVKVPGFIPG